MCGTNKSSLSDSSDQYHMHMPKISIHKFWLLVGIAPWALLDRPRYLWTGKSGTYCGLWHAQRAAVFARTTPKGCKNKNQSSNHIRLTTERFRVRRCNRNRAFLDNPVRGREIYYRPGIVGENLLSKDSVMFCRLVVCQFRCHAAPLLSEYPNLMST